MKRHKVPEINTGSMADIAFLLLIFFLVTTTLEIDSGISLKIPPKNDIVNKTIVKNKNILEILINKKNELFVENEIIEISNLKQIAIDFIDNGGGKDINNTICDWCKGYRLPTSSDHPSKAVIYLKSDRATSYETYISVLDQLNSAYMNLRNKLAIQIYNQDYKSMIDDFKSSNKTDIDLQNKINLIRQKYPLLISDAESIE